MASPISNSSIMSTKSDDSSTPIPVPERAATAKAPGQSLKARKRSRSGCFTCRVRRVKCDEAKPVCQKCASTGRKCDGYNTQTATKAAKKISFPLVIFREPGTCQIPSQCTIRSVQSFQLFRQLYAPVLSSYGTSFFWNTIVLQASHANEAIKHLVIAAANAGYWQAPQLEHKEVVFFSHYSRALAALRNPHQDAIMTAIASILLALCEELQNNPTRASIHIQAGRQILASQNELDLRKWDGTLIMDEISSTLSRFAYPLTPPPMPIT